MAGEAAASGANPGGCGLVIHTLGVGVNAQQRETATTMFQFHVPGVVIGVAGPGAIQGTGDGKVGKRLPRKERTLVGKVGRIGCGQTVECRPACGKLGSSQLGGGVEVDTIQQVESAVPDIVQ